jgi:hypothetical protein
MEYWRALTVKYNWPKGEPEAIEISETLST